MPIGDRISLSYENKLLRELVSERNREAFSELYLIYSPRCKAFVYSLLKDNSTTEDIVHDIFTKIWLKRDAVSQVSSFSNYLYRMARNAVFDFFERNLVCQKYQTFKQKDPDVFGESVEDRVNAHELELAIFHVVSSMPEKRKIVFSLSRYKGLDNCQIADLLDISIRTVENHLSTAMAEIRKYISKL